jgi:hypothetical protein
MRMTKDQVTAFYEEYQAPVWKYPAGRHSEGARRMAVRMVMVPEETALTPPLPDPKPAG